MIDYRKKITTHRLLYPMRDINMSIESDRGRILSSPAFRRLQKRTQVFALELNASIRTRLTHSLEVGQTARYIAKTILDKLDKSGEAYGIEGIENAFISTAEMTSLLHDIGNPPFGHSAEETINRWIEKNAIPMLESFDTTSNEVKELKEQIKLDISNYDGNAQAIRVITKLQRLNLSYTQILSVLKYTRGAYEKKPAKDEELYYLKKKPGFYYSEKEFIENIQKILEVEKGHRFPLTYIMEAADDISYLTADLEDAVEKGILTLEKVYNLIKQECEKEDEHYLLELIKDRYQKTMQNEEAYQFNMFFAIYFKPLLVRDLVQHVSQLYIDNHEVIFNGTFNNALLEYDKQSKYYKAVKILQNISVKYIYQNKEVQELELQGYTIVNGLLESYKPLLDLSSNEFEKLVNGEDKEIEFLSKRLIKRVSSKQIAAYKQDVEKLDKNNTEQFRILEWYYRIRLLVDYISGMTDDFALEEYYF